MHFLLHAPAAIRESGHVAQPAHDLIQRAFAAFSRRDVDGMAEFCHPEIEWRPMRASKAGTVYRGHEGVRRAIADVAREFEELRNVPRRIEEVGNCIVVIGRLVARERSTGVRIDRPAAWLIGVREGQVASMQAFPDGDSAIAAARKRAAGGSP